MDEAEKLLEERGIYPATREIESAVTLAGLEVEAKGHMEVLFSLIRGDSVNEWEIDSLKRAGRTIPSEYIRRYHMIKNMGGENDGDNK